jgi:flagellar motility protein MotE (MotC chaperone)
VLTPILKNVPVVNKILPRTSETETTDPDSYGGYSNLQEASDAVKQLELEVDRLQAVCDSREEEIENLKAENERLEQFEAKQVEFQRIQNEFYEEVVYAENGPGAEEFKKWYEEMDPTTAEYLYRQVVTQLEESEEIQDYANVYSEMKPKQAAAIFEEMTDDLNLVAKILSAMTAEERADILGVMDSEVAAKLTKIMNPDS